MRNLRSLLLILSCLFFSGVYGQDFKVNHLSDSHSMIRISSEKKYILLPIQESAPEARIKVLVDTRLEQTIQARLAVEKVDYYVPFNLSPYKGHQVLFDLTQHAGRETKRNIADNVCWKEIKCNDSFDTTNREKFRPDYHFTPAYGWMNDPNGMVYKDGEYHLFYQYNPYGSMWGNMTWGHAVTKDLVHWTHLDPAIYANELGAVFSGSAIVDKNNVAGFGKDAIIAMYTSAGTSQTQSLAYSTDNGRTFKIYEKNPVITADIPDFRDPKLFFDEQTNEWKVIIASGQEVRFFTSKNLKDWTYESSFGLGYGNHDGVWECPDLVKVKVQGSNEMKDVLLLNINPGFPFGGSATQYFVGHFNGHRFICDSKPEITKWMDYGKDHYATVTWSNAPDNRIIALAWMSNWQYANIVPTQQFRSANSVPRDLSLFQDGDEYYLCSSPSPELLSLRGKPWIDKRATVGKKAYTYKFKKEAPAYEIVLSAESLLQTTQICLSNDLGEKVLMTYDADKKTFSMNRNESGEVNFSKDFPIVTTAPTFPGKDFELRILVDRCSIEAFLNDGRTAMTNLVFPTKPYNRLSITSTTSSKMNIQVYPLNI